MSLTQSVPNSLRAWLIAIRPRTLTASVAPVIVGTAVAEREDALSIWPAVAALLGALALQVGANLSNDVSDFRRGADSDTRLGPVRVTQGGLLSQAQVLTGSIVSFALAALVGVYLTIVAGWPVIVIGLSSILAAIAYTAGPWPYGYRGLGDTFVFLFFGVVAVVGTYFVQVGEINGIAFVVSLPVALTVTAILVVNNVRDIDTDRAADKRTLAVLLGRRWARVQFAIVLAGAYLALTLMWIFGNVSVHVMLPWLSIPLLVRPLRAVFYRTDGQSLNRALRDTARLHLIFGVLLAAGLVL